MQTWTVILLKVLAADEMVTTQVVDTAVRWRLPRDMTPWRRLPGGAFQAFRDSGCALWHMVRRRPDCVHLNTSASLSVFKDCLIVMAAKLLGVRVVIHYHVGFLPSLARQHNWQWKMIAATMTMTDAVIVLGEDTATFLRGCNLGVDIRAIPNPIDWEESPVMERSQPSRRVRLLFLGQVFEGKGIFQLLQACRRLDPAEFELEVVGSVSESNRAKVRELAGPGHEQWLCLVGEVPRAEAVKRLRAADILVLPSIAEFEAFPYVVLEAMVSGRAIVASRRGAIPEILDAGATPCGLIVEPGNIDDLFLALRTLIRDEPQRVALGQRARLRAEQYYRAEKVVGQLREVWFS